MGKRFSFRANPNGETFDDPRTLIVETETRDNKVLVACIVGFVLLTVFGIIAYVVYREVDNNNVNNFADPQSPSGDDPTSTTVSAWVTTKPATMKPTARTQKPTTFPPTTEKKKTTKRQTIKPKTQRPITSTKATPPAVPTTPAGCFWRDSLVYVQDRGLQPISELTLGTRVLVADGGNADGQTFSTVYAWLHKSHSAPIKFLEITFDSPLTNSDSSNYTSSFSSSTASASKSIILTPNHIIFHRPRNVDAAEDSADGIPSKIAGKLTVQDQLVVNGEWTNITRITVLYVTDGAYAPVTYDGRIVVNGVLCSCYTHEWLRGLIGHRFIHGVIFCPLRGFTAILEFLFGMDLWSTVPFLDIKFEGTENVASNKEGGRYVVGGNLWYVDMWKHLHGLIL